jgi:hypothetical protein
MQYLLSMGVSSLFLHKFLILQFAYFLIPRAQELELEDHQSRLEQKLREKMLKEGEYSDLTWALHNLNT